MQTITANRRTDRQTDVQCERNAAQSTDLSAEYTNLPAIQCIFTTRTQIQTKWHATNILNICEIIIMNQLRGVNLSTGYTYQLCTDTSTHLCVCVCVFATFGRFCAAIARVLSLSGFVKLAYSTSPACWFTVIWSSQTVGLFKHLKVSKIRNHNAGAPGAYKVQWLLTACGFPSLACFLFFSSHFYFVCILLQKGMISITL